MVDSVLIDLGKALPTLAADKLKEGVTFLVGVREEGEKLWENLKMINSLLADAEKRELVEESVKCWLDLLKDVVYDIEDVLDDWTMEVKLANKGKRKHDDIDQNEATSSDHKEKKKKNPSSNPLLSVSSLTTAHIGISDYSYSTAYRMTLFVFMILIHLLEATMISSVSCPLILL